MKKLLSAIAIAAALGCSCAAASPLVTAAGQQLLRLS